MTDGDRHSQPGIGLSERERLVRVFETYAERVGDPTSSQLRRIATSVAGTAAEGIEARDPVIGDGAPSESSSVAAKDSAAASVGPVVTVLIASWNAVTTIERAIASALDAPGIALECVVVDDGSTDGTAEVVKSIAARDARVVLIRLATNVGVSAARNQGISVARGTWLTFLDADDRLLPGAIPALMGPTADPTVRAVIGQRVWTDGERTWISAVYDIADIRQPGRKSIATHPGLVYYASATGKLVHRSLATGLTFEGRVLGDQPWTIRALLRAGSDIEVIDDTVYEWTRPHKDHYVPTITAAKQAHADLAAAMVDVARSAFASISAEVDEQVTDMAARHRVKVAYLDRLIRSDFAVPVASAIDRRDPATGRLYDAVAAFLESVPTDVLASSTTLVSRIVRPPIRRWRSVPRAVRPSYWRMIMPALRADPGMARRIGGLPLLPTFWLVRQLDRPVGTGLASPVLWGVSTGWSVYRWVRRR